MLCFLFFSLCYTCKQTNDVYVSHKRSLWNFYHRKNSSLAIVNTVDSVFTFRHMMKNIRTWFVVGLYAFVPWVTIVFVLHFIVYFPRIVFIGLHYVLSCLLFGFIFSHYFEVYPGSKPFEITGIALVCVFVFEWIFFYFFENNAVRLFDYVDWIFPMFLLASSLYFVGSRKIWK